MNHLSCHLRLSHQSCPDQTWETSLCALGVLVLLWIPVSVRAQECDTVWTEAALNRTLGLHAISVAHNGSRFVCAGRDYSGAGITRVWRSDNDGVSWTLSNTGIASPYFMPGGIAYGNGRFVMGGNQGDVAVSVNDGNSWTEYPFPINTFLRCIIWDGSRFIVGCAIGGTYSDTGFVATSVDGISWTTYGIYCWRVNDLAYSPDDSRYVSVEHWPEAIAYSSEDAITWTQRLGTPGGLKQVTYGNGMFVAGGEDGSEATLVMRSSDGITWTRSPTPNVGEILGVGYDGNLFLGVGIDFCITSSDGQTWTEQTVPVPEPGTFLYDIGGKTENGVTTTLIVGRKAGERIFYSQCYMVPFITEHPEDPLPCNNGSGQFCVTATGAPPLSYQWERDVGGGWGNISGAQSTCYTISPVSTADEGQYRCRVWNDKGTVTSNSASLTVRFPPTSLSEQPANQDVCEFESPEFCVTASDGTPPLSYQWERNTGSGWGDVPDGDERCLTVSDVDPAENEDQYRCRVWNDCGTITSDPATLEVHARAKADFDCDDDVDQDDFGHFQGCLSGSGIEQDDPICADARLDGDTDVDAADFAKFLNCLSGPGITANIDCADG